MDDDDDLRQKLEKKEVKVCVAFLIISLIFLLFGRMTETIILMTIIIIMLFDKMVLSLTKFAPIIGLELVTIGIILVGINYGPIFGFLFGFFGLPLFDLIGFVISPPLDVSGFPPGIPTPDTFLYGVLAVIGWAMKDFLYFPTMLLILSGIKCIFLFFNSIRFGGRPNFVYLFLNPVWNFFMANFFMLRLSFLIS